MSQRWTFYDPVGDVTYTFLCNPNAESSPVYQKNMQFEALTVPGGLPLLFEGQDTPTTFNITISILVQSQYSSLLYFYNLRHQFLCTDDLGRQRWFYCTGFSTQRKMSRTYPWRQELTLSGYQFGEEVLPDVANPNAPYPYAVP
jgi:hypothetical protein